MKNKTLIRRGLELVLAFALAATVFITSADVRDFTDVSKSDWFYNAVGYTVDYGLMTGTSPTTFSPHDTMSRGQFVTVLGRMEKVNTDTVSITGQFKDVQDNVYYTPYIYWANAQGIVDGTSETTFGPEDSINREQMATILDRYITSKNLRLEPNPSIDKFTDEADISSWAQAGTEAMREIGIVAGDDNGSFNPKRNMSRAEGATVFMRLHLLLKYSGVDFGSDKPADYVPATSVAVDSAATRTMFVGESVKLTAKVLPVAATYQNVAFTSSNGDIITVDSNGTLTAVSEGKATITVKNDDVFTPVSTTIEITVKEGISADDLVFENSELHFEFGNIGSDIIYFYGKTDNSWGQYNLKGQFDDLLSIGRYVSDSAESKHFEKTSPSSYGITYKSSDESMISVDVNGRIIITGFIEEGAGEAKVTLSALSPAKEVVATMDISLSHMDYPYKNDDFIKEYQQAFTVLVNEERKRQGVQELTYNHKLQSGSDTRGRELDELFSHTRPNGKLFSTAFSGLDPSAKGLAECAGRDAFASLSSMFFTPEAAAQIALDGFMSSPAHMSILMSEKYDKICVGVYWQEGKGDISCEYFTAVVMH